MTARAAEDDTTGEGQDVVSRGTYVPAEVSQEPADASCTSSAEVAQIPLRDTVFASSKDEVREVSLNPLGIAEALEAAKKNETLKRKGLG